MRLIAEDDVMEILCKYVRDSKQKTIVYEITNCLDAWPQKSRLWRSWEAKR